MRESEAGQIAESRFDWETASRDYQAALDVLAEREAGDPSMRAELLVGLGRSERNLGHWRPAWRALTSAFDIHRQREDAAGMAQTAIEIAQSNAPPVRRNPLLDESLDALGDADPPRRALLIAFRTFFEDSPEATAQIAEATRITKQHDAPAAAALLSVNRLALATIEGDAEALIERHRAAQIPLAEAGLLGQAAEMMRQAGMALLWAGRLNEAAEDFRVGDEFAVAYRLRYYELMIVALAGMVATARCDFGTLDTVIGRLAGTEDILPTGLAPARWELVGDFAAAREALPRPEAAGGIPTFMCLIHGLRARIYFHDGDIDAAREEIAEWSRFFAGQRLGPSGLVEIDVVLAELGEDEIVQEAYDDLVSRPKLLFHGRGFDLIRGSLAMRLQRIDDAARHYAAAVAWAETEGLPVEEGRAREGLAAVAAARDDSATAEQQLRSALALFEGAGADFFVAQARGELTAFGS